MTSTTTAENAGKLLEKECDVAKFLLSSTSTSVGKNWVPAHIADDNEDFLWFRRLQLILRYERTKGSIGWLSTQKEINSLQKELTPRTPRTTRSKKDVAPERYSVIEYWLFNYPKVCVEAYHVVRW